MFWTQNKELDAKNFSVSKFWGYFVNKEFFFIDPNRTEREYDV